MSTRKLRILCGGHLVRHPVGGHSWHHLQYLVGFSRLGHDVCFVEHYGWPSSCYDVEQDQVSSDPTYGVRYVRELLRPHGLENRWCYLAEDGRAHGMSRGDLLEWSAGCDLYLNLSNMNWIEEIEQRCRRRALVDTDPVFTQIGAHGMAPMERYDVHFTYGQNVHRDGTTMPTGGFSWLPTRQPVVLDLWTVQEPDPSAAWTSVINWTAYGDHEHGGTTYGQKNREFEPYWDLPAVSRQRMQLAVAAPSQIKRRLLAGGWHVIDPLEVTRTPQAYQTYLRRSRGEWCVAKHGYVSTRCGWFSDRSAGYLASGRPVILQDTGFSDDLPCGKGLLAFADREQVISAFEAVDRDYPGHCRAARHIAESCFDSRRVLTELLERAL